MAATCHRLHASAHDPCLHQCRRLLPSCRTQHTQLEQQSCRDGHGGEAMSDEPSSINASA